MNSWTEIKISVDAADVDRAADIAGEAAPGGIYIEDYRALEQEVEDIAHIDLISTPASLRPRRSHFFRRALLPRE